MGSGQSGALKDSDIGALVVEEDVFVAGTYHLVPFDERPSTTLTKAHRERALEILHKLSSEVAQSDTDGGATDPDVWMRMSRLMMLVGVDRTVLSQGGGQSGDGASSSDDADPSNNSASGDDDVDHAVSRIRQSLEGKKIKKNKHRPTSSSAKHQVASYRGTVINLLDCARIAVLRSQGQDGMAWFCLGEVLAYLDRRQRHAFLAAQLQRAGHHQTLQGTLQARPQPPSCTIYDVAYNAYECFSKAWGERGVEAALERMVLMEGLRLLSAAHSGASGGGDAAAAQRSTLSNARFPPIPHLREQRREVLEKAISALSQRRCQPSLWFLLSQVLQLRDGTGDVDGDVDGGAQPPQSVSVSYAGRVDSSSPVEVVDWVGALNNILECDPRDFIVWTLAISVVWPQILQNPFHHTATNNDDDDDDAACAHLYAPLPTIAVGPVQKEGGGKAALSMEAAVVCAMQQDACFGDNEALELHVFSNIRGVVDAQQKKEARHSLLGAFGVLLERKVASVSGALSATVLYLAELIVLRQAQQQKMRQRSNKNSSNNNTDWLPGDACDALICQLLAASSTPQPILSVFVVEGNMPFDRGSDEIALIVDVLQCWPKRAVLWRYLGVLLARQDEARYVQYFSTLASGVKPITTNSSASGSGSTDTGGGVRVRSRLKAAAAAAASESAGHRYKKKALLAAAAKGAGVVGDAIHLPPQTPPPLDALLGGGDTPLSAGGFYWRPAHVTVDGTDLSATDCVVMALVQDDADPVSWFCAAQLLRRYDVDMSRSGVDWRRSRSIQSAHFGTLDAMACVRRCFDVAHRASPSSWRGEGILRGGADVVPMRRMIVAYAALCLGEVSRADRLLGTRRRHPRDAPESDAFIALCKQEQRFYDVAAEHLSALAASLNDDGVRIADVMLLAHVSIASLEAGILATPHPPSAKDLTPLRLLVTQVSTVLFGDSATNLTWTSGLIQHIRRMFLCCEEMLAWSEAAAVGTTSSQSPDTKDHHHHTEGANGAAEDDDAEGASGGFMLERLLLMEASEAFMSDAIALAEEHAAEDAMAAELVLRSSLSSVLPAVDLLLSQHTDGTRSKTAWLGTFVENMRTRWLKELLWVRDAGWGRAASTTSSTPPGCSSGDGAAAAAQVLVLCSFLLYVHMAVGEHVTWITALATRAQREQLWRAFASNVPAEDGAQDVSVLDAIIRGVDALDDAAHVAASSVLSPYRQLRGVVELTTTGATVVCRLLRGAQAIVADTELQALRQSFLVAGGASPSSSILMQELHHMLLLGSFVANAKFSPSCLNNVSSWPEPLPWMRPVVALEAVIVRGYWSARLGNADVAHRCVEAMRTWVKGQSAVVDEASPTETPRSSVSAAGGDEGAAEGVGLGPEVNEMGRVATPMAGSVAPVAAAAVAGFVDVVHLLLALAGECSSPTEPMLDSRTTTAGGLPKPDINDTLFGGSGSPVATWLFALMHMAEALQRLTTRQRHTNENDSAMLQNLSTHVAALSHTAVNSFLALKADLLCVMAWWLSVQDSPPPIALRVRQAQTILINAAGLLQHAVEVCHHPRIVFCRSVLSAIHQRGEGSSRKRVLAMRWDSHDTLHGVHVLQLAIEVHPRVRQHPTIAMELWRSAALAQIEGCVNPDRREAGTGDCWGTLVDECPDKTAGDELRVIIHRLRAGSQSTLLQALQRCIAAFPQPL